MGCGELQSLATRGFSNYPTTKVQKKGGKNMRNYNNVMKRHMAGIRRATNGKSAYEISDNSNIFITIISKINIL